MNLKELARTYSAFDGAVVFYMMPYRTIKVDVVSDGLNKAKPRAEWGDFDHFFCYAEALTVDIEFGDNLTGELAGLKAYWQGRNGSAAVNNAAWWETISQPVMLAWMDAYHHTRDTTIDAEPEASGEATDPNAQAPARKQRSKRAGAK